MPSPQLRILIIDDEDADREEFTEWLTRREKMTVSTAASAREGLQLLCETNGRFDAVILDQVLPDIDGIEVTRQIRAHYPSIFIVILTGKGPHAGLEALRAGAYRYISKPGDNEEIAFLLKHIGEIRQMEQRLLDEKRLVKATRSIAEHAISSSRSDLLNYIAQGASQLLDVPICIVWELDLTDERFKVAAHFGPVDVEYRQSVFIDSREVAFRDFLQTREPLVLTDIQSANAYQHKKEAAARGWRSLMSVPLATQARVFAILDVISCEPRVFAPWEKQSLATFAAQAGLAIRQTGLLQHFQEIGRLALSRDFKALSDYVVDAVSDLTGTAASLWMIEKADNGEAALRIKAGHGLRKEYMDAASLSLDPTLSAIAAGINSRRPISKPDIFDDSTPPPFPYKGEATLRGWKSFLSVPLLGPTGRPLGALSIYGAKVREFGRDELELLSSFANQAAIAFENLLERQGLESLAKLGEAVSSRTLSAMKSVLEEAAVIACGLTGADHTAIYPYDPDRVLFYDLDNVVIYPPDQSLPLQNKPRERGLAAKVRQLGELIVTDIEAGGSGVVGFADMEAKGVDPQDLLLLITRAHFIERHEIRAFIGISLKASLTEESFGRAGEEVGVLYIDYRAPQEFTQEDLNRVRIFGQQIATAINTARLIEETRRLNKQANALRDVAEAIASPDLKPGQIAKKILDELHEVIAYKTATLQLIQEDGDTRELIAARGFSEMKASPYDPQLLRPLSKDNLIREVVASKGTHILPDTHKWEGWGNNPNTAHVRSWACVPLVHGEKAVGLLTLEHDTPEFYQPAMGNTLAAFGGQAAVAIRNQQLWGELQRRVSGYKALNWVGMALIDAQNEDSILEIAVTASMETLGCVHCSGFRVQGNEIVVVASRGNRARDFPEGRTFALGASVTGWVAQEGKTSLVPDTRTDTRFCSGWSHPDPLALAVVPILLDGQVYGVISAEDDSVYAFDKIDLSLLETLASQVSQAIRNVRLHAAEQRRTEQLKRLSDVTLAMTEMTGEKVNLQATLNAVFRSINSILGAHTSGSINLYDAKTNSFGESIQYGPLDSRLRDHRPRPHGTRAWVVHERKPIFADDAADETSDHPPMRMDFRNEVQSYAVLPLSTRSEVLGTLYLDMRQKYTFSPEIQEVLWIFARQAAIAIENARLLTDARSRLEQLNALQEASHGIVQELDPMKLLPIVIERAAGLIASGDMKGIGAGYWRCDHERQKIINEYSRSPSLQGAELDFGTGLVGKVVRCGRAEYVNDYPNSPERALSLDQGFVNNKLQNLIAVPVKENGKVVAVLVISSDVKRNRQFSDADVELLERFSSLALIAIHNAGLYADLQDKARIFAALNEAGKDLITQPDPQAVMEHAARHAQVILGADAVVIYRYGQETRDILLPPTYVGVNHPDRLLGAGKFYLEAEARALLYTEQGTQYISKAREADRRRLQHSMTEGEPTFVERERVESSARLRLEATGEIVGALFVNYRTPHTFEQPEREMIELLASQVAVAIQNQQRWQELRRLAKGYKALNSAGIALINAREEGSILQIAVHASIETLGCAHCYGFRVEGQKIVVIASVGNRAPDFPRGRAFELGAGVAGWVAQEAKPALVPDARADTRFTSGWTHPDPMALAVAPILLDGRVYGVISAEDDWVAAFDENDLRLLETLASQVSQALRIYRRTADTLCLNHVSEQIRSPQNRRQIYEVVVTRV